MTTTYTRIRYFSTKAAAIKELKATGYQREDRCKDAWFKYAPWGRPTFSARVGRASHATHSGLWAISYDN